MFKRVAKELSALINDPVPGIALWAQDEANLGELEAAVEGPPATPYSGGVFYFRIGISNTYPIEPPKIQMTTKIYHPNIDDAGRICLDTLKLPPQGSWKPSLSLRVILLTLRALIEKPNPDDGLVAEISSEFKSNPSLFEEKARHYTRLHAIAKDESLVPKEPSAPNPNPKPPSASKPLRQLSDPPLSTQVPKTFSGSNNQISGQIISPSVSLPSVATTKESQVDLRIFQAPLEPTSTFSLTFSSEDSAALNGGLALLRGSSFSIQLQETRPLSKPQPMITLNPNPASNLISNDPKEFLDTDPKKFQEKDPKTVPDKNPKKVPDTNPKEVPGSNPKVLENEKVKDSTETKNQKSESAAPKRERADSNSSEGRPAKKPRLSLSKR